MSIVLDRISKRFGHQIVLDDVSLDVADGELFVLLGASGSGKSTVLRIIAGLSQPSGGRVVLDGRDVSALPPQQRGTGLVFQNYSIFRHMSVAQNIEFGMKIRKVATAEREERREQLLDMVGMSGLGSRYADQLSGGQQQRVALARALAYEPSVLLLDEPFGALDVKIRGQLRRSLKEIQRQLKLTTILVTHDQEEAFELADRIGVMDRGRLFEVGSAEGLYDSPQSLFVATFLGAGNVLVGRAREGQARFGPLALPIPAESPHEEGAHVQLLFRPEHVNLSATQSGDGAPVIGQGAVVEQNFTGPLRRVRLRLARLPSTRQVAPAVPFGEESMLVDAVLPSDAPVDAGPLWVSLRDWRILRRPRPHLLVYDTASGPTAHLTLANWIAQRWGAVVSLLGVAPKAEDVEELRAALSRRQEEAGLVSAQPIVRNGHAIEQIASEQSESVYDMLMLASTGGAARKPEEISPITLTMLERPDVPLLVVRGKPAKLERILICTAGGEPGKSDVRVGGQLARRVGASVTLLYVARDDHAVPVWTRRHLERAAGTLRALDVESQVQIRQARRPVEGILAEAHEHKHDLIVVGSHGPQIRSTLSPDDITSQVIAASDRSVLVVPPEVF